MRTLLDIGIFFARHLVVTFLVFFLVGFAVERLTGYGRRWSLSPAFWRRLLTLTCAFLLAGFVLVAGWYWLQDGFAGEVEPTVASLSWLVAEGEPLYHGLDEAARYSVLYGPSVFLTNGLFLEVLGPSVASAKAASLLGVLGSLVFLYAALARPRRDLLALGFTALAVLFYWTQGFAVYLVRPDSLLLFAVGFGLFAAVRTRPWLAVLAVGAAMGFAINLKVHGAVYFIPVLAVLMRTHGLRAAVAATLASLPFVAAPFVLHPQVDAANYVAWLKNAVRHGLDTGTLADTLRYGVYILLPAIAVFVLCRRPGELARDYALPLGALVVATVLALVSSAKPGAGLVHLLPLVPAALYLAGRMFRRVLDAGRLVELEGAPGPRRAAAVAVVMTALVAGGINEYRAVKLIDWQFDQAPGLVNDLRGVLERYPDLSVSMAVGGENVSFIQTWLRPLLVFADQPLLLDPIAVMDYRMAGRDLPDETYRAVAEGDVQVWLVPRDREPFAKLNWYEPHGPVFPDRFRTLFRRSYTLRDKSKYFDLWFFNGLPTGTARPSPVVRAGETAGVLSP